MMILLKKVRILVLLFAVILIPTVALADDAQPPRPDLSDLEKDIIRVESEPVYFKPIKVSPGETESMELTRLVTAFYQDGTSNVSEETVTFTVSNEMVPNPTNSYRAASTTTWVYFWCYGWVEDSNKGFRSGIHSKATPGIVHFLGYSYDSWTSNGWIWRFDIQGNPEGSGTTNYVNRHWGIFNKDGSADGGIHEIEWEIDYLADCQATGWIY